MPQFQCPHCGYAAEVETEQFGRMSACPKCGKSVRISSNQPEAADTRGTAAGRGANPVVLLVVGAVIIAFFVVGGLVLTGALPFGPQPPAATTDLQDQDATPEEKLRANVPSETTEPDTESDDNRLLSDESP